PSAAIAQVVLLYPRLVAAAVALGAGRIFATNGRSGQQKVPGRDAVLTRCEELPRRAHSALNEPRAAAELLRVFVFDRTTYRVCVVHQHDRLDAAGVAIEVEHVGAVETDASAVLERPVV